MEAAAPAPLLTTWLTAVKRYNDIEASTKDSRNPALQADIVETIQLLRTLQSQIQAANMFSKTEDIEDVVTSTIKYRLCEYYLGMLELKVVDEDRKSHCLKAKHYLTAFLEDADRSALLAKEDKQALRNDFSDPGARRQDLIAREKRSLVAKKRLEELIKLKEEKVKAKGAEVVEEGEADDELEREVMVLTVQNAARQALRELDMTNRELEMLAMMSRGPPPPPAAQQSRPPQKGPAQAAGSKPAAKMPAPMSLAAQQQSALGKTRDQIIAEVFRPGWTQPTYMVEDAVEIDIANGKIVQETNKSKSSKKKSESDEEDDDQAIHKQRAWDDWKDTHPAGSGNRYRQG